MTRLVLDLPVPPSANRYWRMGRSGKSGYSHMHRDDVATQYKADVYRRACEARGLNHLAAQWHQNWPMYREGVVRVTILWYRYRRSGDLDNRLKVMLDALQGIAYDKDSQVVEIHAYRRDTKGDPSVRIEVEQIPEPELDQGVTVGPQA